MDLRKIGKLIAKLRNEKGLTQQELGDLVGVGFRAVSRWERGINLPDIGNINELSKIFGVSNDEILKGELKLEDTSEETLEEEIKEIPNKKKPIKVKIIISIITALIIIIITTIIFSHNKEYTYEIISANEQEYYFKGKLILDGKNITIRIEKLRFKDQLFSSKIIHNYEYQIYANGELIFGYGDSLKENKKNQAISIQNFTDNLKINYSGKTKLNKEQLNDDSILIKLTMWDINSRELTKELKIKLISKK